jgi:hypothetical protein
MPDIDISWLAANPASQVLNDAGEKLLPDSDRWLDYTSVAEKTAGKGSLILTNWLFRSRKDWASNVEVFKNVLDKYPFDLIIGDETSIYDFIGMESTSKNPFEILATYLWNKKWVAGAKLERFPIELTIFDGEPEDVPDRKLGFLLPNMRDFARGRCEFVGYIINADFEELKDQTKIREKLGYGGEPLVICSIGGTAVGKELLDLCIRAYPLVIEKLPNLKMVLVYGPRVDTRLLTIPEGIMIKGYVPNLIEHFAACDLAVVQGGGTTTLELTALKRPFLYFPLERHCEQQFHVAGRLARHSAGVKMSFKNTTPESLAESIVANIGKEVNYESIPTDGAHNAASKIRRFLD